VQCILHGACKSALDLFLPKKVRAACLVRQVRVQRAAAALAQRKATARAAAEEAQQSGQGLKGPKHKQGPSSSFMSMSRDQVSLQSMPCCWHGHVLMKGLHHSARPCNGPTVDTVLQGCALLLGHISSMILLWLVAE